MQTLVVMVENTPWCAGQLMHRQISVLKTLAVSGLCDQRCALQPYISPVSVGLLNSIYCTTFKNFKLFLAAYDRHNMR